MTYTYALLGVSQSAYQEIRDSLERHGYQGKLYQQSDGRVAIDMHGIALVPINAPPAQKPTPSSKSPCRMCGRLTVHVDSDPVSGKIEYVQCDSCGDHYRVDGPDA